MVRLKNLKSKVIENTKGDISFLILGIILFFVFIIPTGPFGFLPPNIALLMAVIVSFTSIMRYSDRLSEWIKRREERLELVGIVILFFFWFCIKTFCIHPSTTDENIYFYMAKRFSEGLIPYRDFFFAHPPMHLIIPAVVFKLSGFNIVIAKLIPITAAMVSGIFLYKLLRMLSGATTAFAGVIYYLFGYQVLMASSDMTGVNITAMFISISVYYLFLNRPVVAGLFSALAISSGLYASALLIAIIVYLIFIRDFAGLLRYAFSVILLSVFIFGAFYIIGKEGFITGVFRYHLIKPEKMHGRVDIFSTINPIQILYGLILNSSIFLSSREFLKSIYFHSYLFIPFFIGIIYFVTMTVRDFVRRKKISEPPFYRVYRVIGFAIISFIAFILEYSQLREIYDFYLVFLYLFMAIVAGYLIKFLCDIIKRDGIRRVVFITSSFIILLWLYRPLSMAIEAPLFGKDVKEVGERVFYTYKEPHFFSLISDLSKILYYKEYRVVGTMEPFYRHYIWNKNLSFEKAFEISEYVKSVSKDTDTIAGASTIAPLIALLSGRRIAGEEIDTNAKRFRTGLIADEDFFRRIWTDDLRFFITTPRTYFSERYVIHNTFLRNNLIEERRFKDSDAQHFKPLEVVIFKPVFRDTKK